MAAPKKPFKHTPPKGQNRFAADTTKVNNLRTPSGGSAATVLNYNVKTPTKKKK